jgi:hypothetical protein
VRTEHLVELPPRVRRILAESLADFDAAIEHRMRIAVAPHADAAALARLASAIMHSLAVQARAGDARSTFEAIAW